MTIKNYFLICTVLFLLLIVSGAASTIQMQNIALSKTGEKSEIPINLDSAPAGLAGCKLTTVFSPSGVARVVDVKTPEWASLKNVDGVPNESVKFTEVDLMDSVKSSSGQVYLGSLVVEGVQAGTTSVSLTIGELTDDAGNPLTATITPATVTVGSAGSQASPSPTTGPVTSPQESAAPGTTVTVVPVITNAPQAVNTTPTANITCPIPTFTPTPVPTVSVDFKSDVTLGHAPVTVSFTDLSTGYPDRFLWNFGDNSSENVSVVQNPQHTFRIPGVFNVSLTASNSKYNNTTVKTGFITVLPLLQSRIVPNTSTTVYSVPDGAAVYLDNVLFGTTPCVIPNLTPRSYQLRLTKDGYYDMVEPIYTFKGVLPSFISGFELSPHDEKLGHLAAQPPQTGGVYINTYPEQVNVSVDNTTVGKTDIMVMNLPVGIHNLTLKKEGFTDWQDTIEIKNGLSLIQTYTFFKPYFPPEKTSEYVNQTTG